MNEFKLLIYNKLLNLLDEKIESAKMTIQSAKESRDNDTKSSAGDKYETGRAMMQMEIEKSEVQLSKTLKLKRELSQINIQKENKKVAFGSLVLSNQGNYFISIGMGKVEINNKVFFAISLASPIGKLLQNKTTGEKIKFNDKEITITDIF